MAISDIEFTQKPIDLSRIIERLFDQNSNSCSLFTGLSVNGNITPYRCVITKVHNGIVYCTLKERGRPPGPAFYFSVNQINTYYIEQKSWSLELDVNREAISVLYRIGPLLRISEDLGFRTETIFLNKDGKWEMDLITDFPRIKLLTYVEGNDIVSSIEMALDQAEEEGLGISVTDLKLIREKLSLVGLFNKG